MESGGRRAHSWPCAPRGTSLEFAHSAHWVYGDYTWHTIGDTFDNISFDALKRNVMLVAMLVYEPSEDPSIVSRVRRIPPVDPARDRP